MPINRLRFVLPIAIATTSLGFGLLSGQAAEGEKPGDSHAIHWSSEGEGAPENWGGLKEEFAACSAGETQSPIDLNRGITSELSELTMDYESSPLKIINNGHTIQVNFDEGSTLDLDGQTFNLLQFHFHTPSEHTVAGEPMAMEVHLVHQNPDTGALAVVGVFMKEGRWNRNIASLWSQMPGSKSEEKTVSRISVDPAKLLPRNTEDFYRYHGSLTTPPCSEIVNWIVMKEPIQVSRRQIKQFVRVVGENNARPVQPLQRRFLLEAE